jgi:hypothetical protein
MTAIRLQPVNDHRNLGKSGDEWTVTSPIRPNETFDGVSDKLQI